MLLVLKPCHWLRIACQIFDKEVRSPMTERVARRLRLATLGWG